jgi:hypothetical protein
MDRIAHGRHHPTVAAQLAKACDDWTTNGLVVEYWGRDGDGDAWRVHLERSEVQP